MKIEIKRDNRTQLFDITTKVTTLLSALYYIKEHIDSSLTFGSGCRSGVCGACAVIVNGKEVLACSTPVNDKDKIEPLRYHKVQRDLLVDRCSNITKSLKQTNAHLQSYKPTPLDSKDEELNQIQSDCILCSSCYSACPVFAVNGDFAGPYALTRVYRYAIDKRESKKGNLISFVQQNGVWDCTLCGECTLVCPQGIDPKSDILQLRSLSIGEGYSDPTFVSMDFGGGFDSNWQ